MYNLKNNVTDLISSKKKYEWNVVSVCFLVITTSLFNTETIDSDRVKDFDVC